MTEVAGLLPPISHWNSESYGGGGRSVWKLGEFCVENEKKVPVFNNPQVKL